MIKIIQAGFLVVVFGLEAEVAFGGAGLGEDIADAVGVAEGLVGLEEAGIFRVLKFSPHLIADVNDSIING